MRIYDFIIISDLRDLEVVAAMMFLTAAAFHTQPLEGLYSDSECGWEGELLQGLIVCLLLQVH